MHFLIAGVVLEHFLIAEVVLEHFLTVLKVLTQEEVQTVEAEGEWNSPEKVTGVEMVEIENLTHSFATLQLLSPEIEITLLEMPLPYGHQ